MVMTPDKKFKFQPKNIWSWAFGEEKIYNHVTQD